MGHGRRRPGPGKQKARDAHTKKERIRTATRRSGGLIGAWIGGIFVPGRLSTGDGSFLVLSRTTFESCLPGLLLGFLFTRRQQAPRRLLSMWEHLRNGLLLGMWDVLPRCVEIGLAAVLGFGGPVDWSVTGTFLGRGWLSYALVGFVVSLFAKRAGPSDISGGTFSA